MGGTRTLANVLLLPLLLLIYASIVTSTTYNTTHGPGLQTTQNSTTPAPGNGLQETCPTGKLQDASRSISAAVDIMIEELSCKGSENGSMTKDLELNIRHILQSTVKVVLDLSTNESSLNVLEIFNVLGSLTMGNYSDITFIRQWFSIRMAPLLPLVDNNFLIQLGNLNFSCTSFQELVMSMNEELNLTQTVERKRIYYSFIKEYLSRKNLQDPGCKNSVNGSEEWLKRNLASFSLFATLEELKNMNEKFSAETVLDLLTTQQKIQLILDPSSGALENVTLVKGLLTNLTQSGDVGKLTQFFQAFAQINKQTNMTFIKNAAVRDTILNLTLTALAPEFQTFEPKDFELWFQQYLSPVIASFQPDSLLVIPINISCASYAAILTGLQQSLTFLPLEVSMGVRASIQLIQDTFPRTCHRSSAETFFPPK
ncbi:uncharacterized protein LOC144989164 [Oryzias latipes]